jgi:beta-galactosidase
MGATVWLAAPGHLRAWPAGAATARGLLPDRYPPIIPGYPHILHGGDWNPDQWRQEPGTLQEDFALMEESGCNTFSVGIFAWAAAGLASACMITFTPNGWLVAARTSRMRRRISSGGGRLAPRIPHPPARETADASSGSADSLNPTEKMGNSIPSCWHSGVRNEGPADAAARSKPRLADAPARPASDEARKRRRWIMRGPFAGQTLFGRRGERQATEVR